VVLLPLGVLTVTKRAAPGVHPAKATFVTDFRVFSGQSAQTTGK
jgi:hypothetical protein